MIDRLIDTHSNPLTISCFGQSWIQTRIALNHPVAISSPIHARQSRWTYHPAQFSTLQCLSTQLAISHSPLRLLFLVRDFIVPFVLDCLCCSTVGTLPCNPIDLGVLTLGEEVRDTNAFSISDPEFDVPCGGAFKVRYYRLVVASPVVVQATVCSNPLIDQGVYIDCALVSSIFFCV